MYIHNFFADLLLSTRVMLDTYIFQNSNYMQRYEFNMGNRTFQLPAEFKSNFAFPNVMVMLNDDAPAWGQRPEVTQGLNNWSIDQIPVLYNLTTQNTLCVQEEMRTVPITLTINCESQFQTKEIKNVIERWLPINKYIQFMQYTSFLEVTQQYLDKNQFNPSSDQIINLFTKLNSRTGAISYCFSILYNPLIRLDSVSTSISDSTQRSFQVVIDITYMIQLPVYIFNDQLPVSSFERIDINITPNIMEPIADYPSSKMSASDVSSECYVRRQLILSEDSSVETLPIIDSVVLESSQVTATSTGSKLIELIRGADDFLYVNINSDNFKCKTSILALTVDGTSIDIDVDNYLTVSIDSSNNITVIYHQKTKVFTVQFDPRDFVITSNYTFNFICGKNSIRDYSRYVLDGGNNSVTFSFLESYYITNFLPSIISPLILQFYTCDNMFPSQIGGVSPDTNNIKVVATRPNSVIITWTSRFLTTSCIEYGTTTSYGSSSDINTTITNTHKVILSGLSGNTLYHYRVNTVDENGESVMSSDYTFTTS